MADGSTECLDWKPISIRAVERAKSLGHRIDGFERKPKRSFRMASCQNCGGCCWVAWTGRGFGFGGRILRYRCGTPEAAGLKGK